MSSKSERLRNKSPTATSPDTTYTDPVNCQWDTCMEKLSCITDLIQHIEETHLIKGIMEDYVCLWKNCWRNMKPFKDRYRLVNHLRIHSGEKPNKCTVSSPNVTTSWCYFNVKIQGKGAFLGRSWKYFSVKIQGRHKLLRGVVLQECISYLNLIGVQFISVSKYIWRV